ncbi:MAG TPA: hypothetical protein VML94_07905 [Thermoplasmata archaeon]|nr:hypothetical protein [Thermoplasmata archaeon]
MDWVAWCNQTFDEANVAAPLFLDVEATIHDVASNPSYVTGKIAILDMMNQAAGGLPGCVQRLRQDPRFTRFPDLDPNPRIVLLFASNKSEHLPEPSVLEAWLRGSTGSFERPDVRFICRRPASDPESREIELPGGQKVWIGLIHRQKLTELAALSIALNNAKRHQEVDERFLFELTGLAGHPLLLDPLPFRVGIQAPTTGQHVRVENRSVTFHKFTVHPADFLRFSTVLRLVSDYDYLQRLPIGSHLEAMAREVEAGGRFPTPVLCIPPHGTVIDANASQISQHGGIAMQPYSWHIVDGQHRLFCYYFVDRGARVEDVDVNSYDLANQAEKPAVASGLFLSVNYKALKPPIDLALTHHALSAAWPRDHWVCPKRRVGCVDVDSNLYSARILATRLILELNLKSSHFRDYFRYTGTQERGKTSLQSITTYLSPDFDIRHPADARNPIARHFGMVPGGTGVWTAPDPPPGSLATVFETLVREFDAFVSAVCLNFVPPGGGSGSQVLREYVDANNNVFVALWRLFFRYRFWQLPPSGAALPWPATQSRVDKVLPALKALADGGTLYGAGNRFRSASGVSSLTTALIAAFDDGITPSQPLLSSAVESI